MTTLEYFKIYSDIIERCSNVAENAIKYYICNDIFYIDAFHEQAKLNFLDMLTATIKKVECEEMTITNLIIAAYFSEAAAYFKDNRPDLKVYYEVAGAYSFFTVNGKAVSRKLNLKK